MKTLKWHMQSHLSKEKCEFCKKVFTRQDYLKVHQQNVHGIHKERKSASSTFTCEYCNKNFRRKYHLARHTSLVHERVTSRQHRAQFSCRHCDSDFQEYDQLFRQVTENHPLNQRRRTEGNNSTFSEYSWTKSNSNSKRWYWVEWKQEQQEEKQNKEEQEEQQKEQQQRDAKVLKDSQHTTDESALNNAVLNRNIYPRGSERYDVITFFVNIREEVRSFLQSRVRSLGGIKFNICVHVELQRDDGQDVAVASPFFRSRAYFALSIDDINEHDLNEAMQKCIEVLKNTCEKVLDGM